jgi:hypothetical protein
MRLNAESIPRVAVAPFVRSRADDAKEPSASASRARPLRERTLRFDVGRRALQRKALPYQRRTRGSPAKGPSLSTSIRRPFARKDLSPLVDWDLVR